VKTLKFIFTVLFALMIGTAVEGATGIHAFAVAGTLLTAGTILPLMIKDLPKGVAFMAVVTDIEAIRGYIEKYDKKLINQMLNELDIVKDLPVIRNVTEPLSLYKMAVDDGVRPLNLDIEKAKGGRKWTKRVLTPARAMKIIRMVPEELRKTFQSEMLDINATQLPFGQWVWAQEFAKVASEVNDNFYYSINGGDVDDYAPATVYAPNSLVYFNEIVYKMIDTASTTAGQSPGTHPLKWRDVDNQVICDGPDALLNKAVATEGLLTVGTGTFDSTDAYEYLIDMWGNVKESHKAKNMVAEVSFDVAQDIATRQNEKFGSGKGIAGVDIEEGKTFLLKGTGSRLTIKPNTWMLDSRRVIMTMKGNLVIGMDQVSNANKVGKVVEDIHGFTTVSKWMLGAQFRDLEPLYTNDQR